MYRKEIQFLKEWKDKISRKPLIINGARQVGKTWLLKAFGVQCYEQMAYVNFEVNSSLKTVFTNGFEIDKILRGIQIETGVLPQAGKTLIVFDEIQEAPAAITSLKYFYEAANQYHVVCAGSLLGISLSPNSSFPVGKVEILDLFPLDFMEYLEALNQNMLRELIIKHDWELLKTFKQKLQELLKQYLFLGGMPEVVASFSEQADFAHARYLQKNILRSYELDFSKHAPTGIVPRIRMIWNAIPAQLAKENKKFIYKILKSGARAKDFELALSWLVDAGLVYKVHNLSRPTFPLKAYENLDSFKVYLIDVGLLGAMVDLDVGMLLNNYAVLEEFKGTLAEQYVFQQLKAQRKSTIYYWSPNELRSEVDFIVEHNGMIFPLEVKAAENLQAKSLKVYAQKYKPHISFRASMADYRKEDWLTNIPLFAIAEIYDFM